MAAASLQKAFPSYTAQDLEAPYIKSFIGFPSFEKNVGALIARYVPKEAAAFQATRPLVERADIRVFSQAFPADHFGEAMLEVFRAGQHDFVQAMVATAAFQRVSGGDPLGELLLQAVWVGRLALAKRVLASPFFAEEESSKKYFEKVLIAAIHTGNLPFIRDLLAHPEFEKTREWAVDDILIDGYRVGGADCYVRNAEIVEELAQKSRYFGRVVLRATSRAHQHRSFSAVNALIASSCFKEIAAYKLAEIFAEASWDRRNYVQLQPLTHAIIASRLFQRVQEDHRYISHFSSRVRSPFVAAAQWGDLHVVNAIIASPYFFYIWNDTLPEALEEATQHGHVAVVNAMIASPYFPEIPRFRIAGVLRSALRLGHHAIARAVYMHPRFYTRRPAFSQAARVAALPLALPAVLGVVKAVFSPFVGGWVGAAVFLASAMAQDWHVIPSNSPAFVSLVYPLKSLALRISSFSAQIFATCAVYGLHFLVGLTLPVLWTAYAVSALFTVYYSLRVQDRY